MSKSVLTREDLPQVGIQTEIHPFPPFIPEGAKILIMGTFPPPSKRWSMDFYYPNRTNDFWKIMGLIFLNDSKALYLNDGRDFNLNKIKELLTKYKIAMHDTGRRIQRLKGNASDKYLEIIERVHLQELLSFMPCCKTIATTGEKAAGVIAELTGTEAPGIGQMIKSNTGINIWRMPSTSRAYPLAIEKKAEYYEKMFKSLGLLSDSFV